MSFTTFSNHRKSAIYVSNVNKADGVNLNLFKCDFFNNSNELGGGLQLSESNISVAFCRFINNSALVHGGALYLSYLFEGVNKAYLWELNNNIFESNVAQKGGGGALYWKWNIPKQANNTFSKNKASFGHETASQPVRLTLNTTETTQLQRFLSGGTLTSLTLLIVDYYNQTVTTSDSTKVKLSMGKTPWSNEDYEERINNLSSVL